jgi:thymidylate synthase
MKYTHEDGTPFTKEEFLQKLKTDNEFNDEFGNKGIDQISELIKQLKDNPDSRRLLVSAWAVHDLPHQVLPPCHYCFQVYTEELSYRERIEIVINSGKDTGELNNLKIEDRNLWMDKEGFPKRKISLKWNQRSVDLFLGLPFNIASYGLLLEIIAKEVNMIPHKLIGSLGDTHIYSNHIEQVKEQIGRNYTTTERANMLIEKEPELAKTLLQKTKYSEHIFEAFEIPRTTRTPFKLPKLLFKDHLKNFDSMLFDNHHGVILRPKDFILDDYKSHPKIDAPLSN